LKVILHGLARMCHHFVISAFHAIMRAIGVKRLPILANQGQISGSRFFLVARIDLL
jgi:hypothetical protein